MKREGLIARLAEFRERCSDGLNEFDDSLIEAALSALQEREAVVLTDRDKSQIATADREIRKSGEWMANLIDTNLDATCTKEFDMIHTLRHSLRDLYRIVKLLEPK